MISFQWDTKEEAKINFSTPFSFWRLSQVIVHLEWNMVRMYLWNMKKRNMKIRLTWPRKIRFDTINYLMIFDKKEKERNNVFVTIKRYKRNISKIFFHKFILWFVSIIDPTKFDESWKSRCWPDLLERWRPSWYLRNHGERK